MPFLRSPESSRLSSFNDLPGLLFLSSCNTQTEWIKKEHHTDIHKKNPSQTQCKPTHKYTHKNVIYSTRWQKPRIILALECIGFFHKVIFFTEHNLKSNSMILILIDYFCLSVTLTLTLKLRKQWLIRHSQAKVFRKTLCHLLGCGEVGAVRACGAVFGGGATGNVVRVRQRPPLHLSKHTLLVQQGLKEPCVAVELHQVIDLKGWKGRKEGNQWVTEKCRKEKTSSQKER